MEFTPDILKQVRPDDVERVKGPYTAPRFTFVYKDDFFPFREHKFYWIIIKKDKSSSLFSISESLEHPYEAIVLKKNKKWKYLIQNAKNFYRRQDFNLKTFFINGAIYIVSKKHLLKSKKISTFSSVSESSLTSSPSAFL